MSGCVLRKKLETGSLLLREHVPRPLQPTLYVFMFPAEIKVARY